MSIKWRTFSHTIVIVLWEEPDTWTANLLTVATVRFARWKWSTLISWLACLNLVTPCSEISALTRLHWAAMVNVLPMSVGMLNFWRLLYSSPHVFGLPVPQSNLLKCRSANYLDVGAICSNQQVLYASSVVWIICRTCFLQDIDSLILCEWKDFVIELYSMKKPLTSHRACANQYASIYINPIFIFPIFHQLLPDSNTIYKTGAI